MKKKSAAFGLALMIFLLSLSLQAQAQSQKNKSFLSFKLGTFISTQSTDIRLDSETLGKGTEFNFEDELNLDRSQPLFRIDAGYRFSRRFELELGYYRIRKRSDLVDLEKTIQFGDKVYEVGLKVEGFYKYDLVRSNFKYSIFLNETFDLGVYLGVNIIFYKVSLEADFQEGKEAVRKDVWAPVPSLGIHSAWAILPNLYFNAEADYFFYSVTQDLDFDQFQFNTALEFYPIEHLGLGVAYDVLNLTLDGEKTHFSGKLKLKTNGIQIYAIVGL